VKSILALPVAIADAASQYATYWGHISSVRSLFLTFAGTAWGFLTSNWTFFVFGWGLTLFMVPVWITDYLGWRQDKEFPDLFGTMSWLVRVPIILALVYGIVFFARREANEFIYFAF
jgi:hypothetical protein